jgi:L,D-transpeptidase catalytic domain
VESILAKIVGTLPAADRAHSAGLRMALVSTVAIAFVAGLASPADAYPRRLRFFSQPGWYGDAYPRRFRAPSYTRNQRGSEPKKQDVGFGEMPKGPLQIAVNITSQRVTLYSNGVRVAQGPVSTGVPGHPTPRGVFSIIEKDRYHHSNIYSGAPMPFMQRITWSGVAIHEGVLPGHPASHGCIRTSHDFAQKLWPITKLGVRFIVTRHEVEPVDFEHPKLFELKPKPADPNVAQNHVPGSEAGSSAIKLAQAASSSKSDAAPLSPSSDERAELRKSVDVPAAQTMEVAPGNAEASPAASEPVKPAPTIDPPKPIPPRMKSADQPVKRSGQIAVFVSRKEKRIFVRQGMVPMFDMPVVIDEPDAPLGTHVFTALGMTEDGTRMRWNLMTVPTDGSILEREGRRRFREPPKIIYASKAPATAAEALNRIAFPQEALDRISEFLIPGSSLVVSDEGLGRETGRGTEFIVLLRE